MADIIKLLPDSVANQIAAGEVIQRPASVVKELVENAIDAGADEIKVIVRDSGRSLIQVIDNGSGMSETDARLSFERHATSKISMAQDLFAIRTMGFRGEALASIAAVAQVALTTRKRDDELGTKIEINASQVMSQATVSCAAGTNIEVKNLFFNIPARRKFLKSNNTEFRNILQEIERIALPNPHIAFFLQHNGTDVFNLPKENHRQRIVHLFGKAMNQSLVSIQTETTVVKIYGFVAKPEKKKKKIGEQFFFVNNRYMRSPYFHKAVVSAYERLLPPDATPAYFIFLDADPATIDINIHPTKTEIKFEDAIAVFQIIRVAVKESLGKFNVVPSLDFDTEGKLDMPLIDNDMDYAEPTIEINPQYNPFDDEQKTKKYSKTTKNNYSSFNNQYEDWTKLYQNFENENNSPSTSTETTIFSQIENSETETTEKTTVKSYIQLNNRYIATSVKSGLMLIDQKRAHERILYEQFLVSLENNSGTAQQLVFPVVMELSEEYFHLINEIYDDICAIGFDITEFGRNTISINATPADLLDHNPKELLESLLNNYKLSQTTLSLPAREQLAFSLAKAAAIHSGKQLHAEEIREIIDRLFACAVPNYSPDGKIAIRILNMPEIEKLF